MISLRQIEERRRHSFKSTGRPEPLGGDQSGWWSRRIGWEQRLLYRVKGAGYAGGAGAISFTDIQIPTVLFQSDIYI
ncbi:type II toxin-antitoxin system YoeB family toxin [Sphingomonas sp. PB4P5]|uniref:type II toxin-antitoxin system YoeB family toxin n=1 Tax=Parasphingomonas puruogangriensis TaxID=3096155 RepID=UPI002FCA3767